MPIWGDTLRPPEDPDSLLRRERNWILRLAVWMLLTAAVLFVVYPFLSGAWHP
jgi:hypothetical protein